LDAYLDDELREGERSDVERHLGGCAHCAQRLAGLRRTRTCLGEWPALQRAAGAEGSFWLRLAGRLPVRPARQSASPSWRELWFPLGLAFGSACVQAGAWLALAFSALLALGAFGWLDPWLAGALGNAPALSNSSLVRLTWTGWLATEAAALLGATSGDVEAWIGMALGWVGPALFVTSASALIFLGISGWVGVHLSRRPAEDENFMLSQVEGS